MSESPSTKSTAKPAPAASSMSTPAFDEDTGSSNISHRTAAEDRPDDAGAVYATEEEWEEKQGGVEGGTVVAPPTEPAPASK